MGQRKRKISEDDKKKITEREIQLKLYGESKKNNENLIVRKQSKQNDIKSSVDLKNDLATEKVAFDQDIQEEIDTLKNAIANLESKLKRTEGQKDRREEGPAPNSARSAR